MLLWGTVDADELAVDAAQQHRAIALAISREEAGQARDLAEQHVEQNTHRLIEARIELHGGGARGR